MISMASLVVIFVATSYATEGCADGGLGVEATGRAMGAV